MSAMRFGGTVVGLGRGSPSAPPSLFHTAHSTGRVVCAREPRRAGGKRAVIRVIRVGRLVRLRQATGLARVTADAARSQTHTVGRVSVTVLSVKTVRVLCLCACFKLSLMSCCIIAAMGAYIPLTSRSWPHAAECPVCTCTHRSQPHALAALDRPSLVS